MRNLDLRCREGGLLWHSGQVEPHHGGRGDVRCALFSAPGREVAAGPAWNAVFTVRPVGGGRQVEPVEEGRHWVLAVIAVRLWYPLPAAQHHPPVPNGDGRYEYSVASAAQAVLSGPRYRQVDFAEDCQRVRGEINSSMIVGRAVAVRAISTRRRLRHKNHSSNGGSNSKKNRHRPKYERDKNKDWNGTRSAIGRGKRTVTESSGLPKTTKQLLYNFKLNKPT